MSVGLRRLGAGIVLGCLLSLPAHGGPLAEGGEAYSKKDYATAVRLWQPLALQGDGRAQRRLGLLYQYGQGVPRDPRAAYLWLSLAVARLPAGEEREAAIAERDRIGVRLSPPELLDAQDRALQWQPK